MKTFDIDKYIKALDNLLGVDHAYYYGDKDVDTIIELIMTAKNLAEENKVLRNTFLVLQGGKFTDD